MGEASQRALIAGDAASANLAREGRMALADLRGDFLDGPAMPEAVFDLHAIRVGWANCLRCPLG